MKIGLQLHPNKNKVKKILPKLLNFLSAKNHEVFIVDNDLKFYKDLKVNLINSIDEFISIPIDLMISIGGDGTYIGASRNVIGTNIPIMGVHLGGLGFLAEVLIENFENKLNDFFEGKYRIEQRKILETEMIYKDHTEKYQSINDVLINRHETMGMCKFVTYVDNEYLNTYRGDGLIVSTPSGSTAYNMSAGGPIISPHLDIITLTPVCPHSLSTRPVIIGGNQTVTFELQKSRKTIALDIDGQKRILLDKVIRVHIKNSESFLNIVRFNDYSFFRTLQTKLNWGVDPRNKE